LPARVTIGVTLAKAVFTGPVIRDNRALNMLLPHYPVERIRRWRPTVPG
jgi:hypothetical protein